MINEMCTHLVDLRMRKTGESTRSGVVGRLLLTNGVLSPVTLILRLPLGVLGTSIDVSFTPFTVVSPNSIALCASSGVWHRLSPEYRGFMSVTGISAILSTEVLGSSDKLLFIETDSERL